MAGQDPTILVIPDPHAHPDFPNDRADWAGELIADIKPDIVVNMGDGADMASLSTHDKDKAIYEGRSYARDIAAHHEFEDRLWRPIKRAKRKKPRTVALIGNHDFRIQRELDEDPRLAGTISMNDLAYGHYDDVVHYSASLPGTITIAGVTFAHYMVSGLMGRPISGENHARTLILKQMSSCVVAHSHMADWAMRTNAHGKQIMGLVAGVYQDYPAPWCGEQVQRMWWRGVAVMRGVTDGRFDHEFISINRLKAAYS